MSWSGLDRVAQANLHRRIPFTLCYHRVVERLSESDSFALPAMEISVAMLEQHLDWLGRSFRIVSLDELGSGMEAAKPLAAVTFDDGYSDSYHHAFPLLKRMGIPAGIFVVTDLVGSKQLPMHERLHALLVGAWRRQVDLPSLLRGAGVEPSVRERIGVARNPFSATRILLQNLRQADVQRVIDQLLIGSQTGEDWEAALQPLSWEMLAEMRDAGMTIGSHTRTHPFLINETEERVLEEAEHSRKELERRLRMKAGCFAYPDGGFNTRVVRAVANAGYRYAFTICRHRDRQHPLLTMPRTPLWERSSIDSTGRFSPSILSFHAAGVFHWTSRCTQAHAEH